MTSKTFKSVLGTTELEVSKYADSHAGLFVSDEDGEELSGFYFDPPNAPALALAILEAAGYGEEVVTDGSPDGHVRVAKYYLYEGVKAHASITAEAEAQAELEAEALELYNVCMTGHNLTSFDGLGGALRDQWLAVARKSRELRDSK